MLGTLTTVDEVTVPMTTEAQLPAVPALPLLPSPPETPAMVMSAAMSLTPANIISRIQSLISHEETMPLVHQHVVPSMTQTQPSTVPDVLDFSNLNLTDNPNTVSYDVASFQSALMDGISPLLGF